MLYKKIIYLQLFSCKNYKGKSKIFKNLTSASKMFYDRFELKIRDLHKILPIPVPLLLQKPNLDIYVVSHLNEFILKLFNFLKKS